LYILWVMRVNEAISQLKRSFAIAKKDMLIFYLKGPVIIMGLLFPLFMFAAFLIGRNLPSRELFVVLLSMTVFFTSTAVGPTIIPWEARSKTFERLLSTPISITTVLLGDMQASFYFGLLISLAISLSAIYLSVSINILLFLIALVLGLLCFSSLTILMSSYPPTDVPADVMMLSSLVKFSLLFISGIFVPLSKLPEYGKILSYLSPLTYFVDSLRWAIGSGGYFSIWLDFVMLLFFTLLFLFGGIAVHKRVLERRFR